MTNSQQDHARFSLNDQYHDMKTYMGRFNSLVEQNNPIHAFYSRKTIRDFQAFLQEQTKREEEHLALTGDRRIPMSSEEI
jgi:hypothetical protein